MREAGPRNPQQTLLFRSVALLTRFQLSGLFRRAANPQVAIVLFVFISGATALGIINVAAYSTALPLLFPPLGPSAFILFYAPMSAPASPRNVILSHSMALVAGLLALRLFAALFPGASLANPSTMNWPRIWAIAAAMGVTSVAMIAIRCAHPPAAATSLLGAMGFLEGPTQVLGFLAALFLLVLEAFVFDRLLGGLPYPRWRSDPAISQGYGVLAGIPEAGATYWQGLASQLARQRRA